MAHSLHDEPDLKRTSESGDLLEQGSVGFLRQIGLQGRRLRSSRASSPFRDSRDHCGRCLVHQAGGIRRNSTTAAPVWSRQGAAPGHDRSRVHVVTAIG